MDNDDDATDEPSKVNNRRTSGDIDELKRPRTSIDNISKIKGQGSSYSLNTSTVPAVDKSADMYLFIHRLQSDIADHQAIVDRLTKRDREYESMRFAYEDKLNVLQAQVAAVAKERDEALKRMKDPGSGNSMGGPRVGGGDRAGSAAIRARFDDQKKKLESQIGDLRKKLVEGARMQTSSKGRTDTLTKQLMATIEALKLEKAKMLKELKKENEKIRNLQSQKEREIARLRRKEKTAAEIAKKLERSNQLQRL
ncbi:hypothetical protein BC829DRAFT_257968 [Chytridium lagenaria]|nr:hypothetical protein BC829DRAFT_257968 [Chytridium lagenaria]